MPQKLFISYARKDARDLALKLHTDLVKRGYEVWLDTSEIDGGASWSDSIEKAIDGCDVLLALLSTGSYVSEVCRGEQMRARRLGKRIIPLLTQPNAERPIYLEHLNYRDFTHSVGYAKALDMLCADLEDQTLPAANGHPVAATRVSAPAKPDHFIERPTELLKLRQTVLSDVTDRQIALTAVRGMGGIGKTTLATVLCHDPVIHDAFPDGVVFVEIGKDATDLTGAAEAILNVLGSGGQKFNSFEGALSELRRVLPGKSALIVLDDIWHTKHIKPFLIEAPRSRVVFTTRFGSIAQAPGIGASEVRVDIMERSQAIALLQKYINEDQAALGTLADKLGRLPLALKIAGALIQHPQTGISVQAYLEQFQHVSQVSTDNFSPDRDNSLSVCFELSLQKLGDRRELYEAFCIFPTDTPIPQHVLFRLWRAIMPRLTDAACIQLLNNLVQMELFTLHPETKTLTLHDLLHQYARECLGEDYRPDPRKISRGV